MDEAGNTKDDLSLPKGTDDAEKLAQQIQEDFDAGKELVVTVLKVGSSTPSCLFLTIGRCLGQEYAKYEEPSFHALESV